ncbi:MAG: GNAT family N-acetyltransferase [Erysipelotrichaceae bacterium]|nr:GNAT family N-acetyltransferase [Erysipelotrichaceae bacterium]
MIKELNSIDCYMDYIKKINEDPLFSNPSYSNSDELISSFQKAINRPDDHIFGIYEDDELTGLFLLLIKEEEKYMEMIACLSQKKSAYKKLFDYLQMNYPGFQADFVFNPKNNLLRSILIEKEASFDTEQQKMLLRDGQVYVDTSGIEALSERYMDQYIDMHDRDRYWTAEKVAEAKERFDVYLAVCDEKVIGYLDITNCFDENEPYDIMVLEAYRGQGWGRKLLAAAIEGNRPKGMMLQVDVDNAAAIRLYESLGFAKAEGRNSQTVNWMIPA